MTITLRSGLDHPPARPVTPLRLGLLTPHNPFDRTAFSGTAFHAAQALANIPNVQTRLLGGHRPVSRLHRLLRRKGPAGCPPSEIDFSGLDVVVGLVATSLLEAVPLGLPFLHVTDATPAFLRAAYGWDIPPEVDAAEARIAGRAAMCVYSSVMMAHRARRDLGPVRTTAVPFGLNLALAPGAGQDKPPLSPLNLLFVGADWDRKGGAMALAAVDALRAGGQGAHLTVIGAAPPRLRQHPGVTWLGFLDKNRPADAVRLSRAYARAHLLLLPSRADCTPMVIAEAMAHGTPVLASQTGAIPEMIGQSGAGQALPLSAGAEAWAEAIRALTTDRATYARAAASAAERARTKACWDRWAARIAELAQDAHISALQTAA